MKGRQTKISLKGFTVADWKKEEQYLRKMHQKGWRVTRVSAIRIYDFERTTPEDMVYKIDYHPEDMEQNGEYQKLFADCGWDYLFGYRGFVYFRKKIVAGESEESMEIYDNTEERMDMVKRVYRGRVIPLLITLAFGLLSITTRWFLHDEKWFSPGQWVLFTVCLLYALSVLKFSINYYRLRKSI